MYKRKMGCIWAAVIIIIALIVAILASVWPPERLADIIVVTRFFDVMLPILAAGALIKYIAKCGCCGSCGTASTCNKPKP